MKKKSSKRNFFQRVREGVSLAKVFYEKELWSTDIKWTFWSTRVEPRKKPFVPSLGWRVFIMLFKVKEEVI